MDSFITVKHLGEFEFEDRRSIFIGYAIPIKCENDAIDFIASVKKKYPDARHWVYAYVLRENSIMRFTDDSEPQGTAGMPILDIIRKKGITDVAVVIVRYFGGILLGTGGLVHAYSEAAIGALNSAEVITYSTYTTLSINLSYSDHGKCMMAFSECDFLVSDTEYAESVTVLGTVLSDNEALFIERLTEITSGRCKVDVISKEYAYR